MGNTVCAIMAKIDKKYKFTFIATCVIGFLTHFFMLTNLLPGNDQTMFYFNLGGTSPFGRWGLDLLQMKLPLVDTSFIAAYGMPWVKGLISIGLLGLTACIVVAVLEIKNASICILTGAALVTFPSVAATFSYMFTSSSYFLSLVLAAAAVLLAKKAYEYPIWKYIAGGGASVLIMLSLSIYQSYVCFAIGLFVAELILTCVNQDSTFRVVLKKSFYYLFCLIVGLAFYYISIQIMLKFFFPFLSSYQGISDVLSGGIGNMIRVFSNGIGKAYKCFFDVPFVLKETLRLRRILYGCMGLMVVVEIVYLIWKNKIYNSLKGLLCLVLIGIFPMAVNSVYLMGAGSVSTLMLYGTVTPMLLALALTQRFCSVAKTAKKYWGIIYYVACISVLLLTYQHYLITNEAYNRQYFTYEQTYGYMNRVAYDIQHCEEYTADMPVMLLGSVEKEITMPEFEKLNVISGIFGESALVNGYSREEFIRRYCGLPIVIATDLQREETKGTSEYLDMPLYPVQGSVRVINGCCVVKFSN